MSKTDEKIIEKYINLTNQYKIKYGTNTVILLQVGSFYEMYGLENQDKTIEGSNIVEVAEICELNISSKQIDKKTNKPIKMAGFGVHSLDKYLDKIINANYTAVIYDQEDDDIPNSRGKKKHVLNSICSPGTNINNRELTNNIMCIWINKRSRTNYIDVGISNIDILTGKTYIFQYDTEFIDAPSTFDETERYISTYNPNQIIIISDLLNEYNDKLISYLNLNLIKNNIYNTKNEDLDDYFKEKIKNCGSQKYQIKILEDFYTSSINIDDICCKFKEFEYATQSFCFLLDFVKEHNERLIKNISIPIFENYTDRIILANHTLKQLNIIDDNNHRGKLSSVRSLLNNCRTPIGKRRFDYNLLHPTNNVDILNREYEITEFMINKFNNDISFHQEIENDLKQIRDIEVFQRKLFHNKITPLAIVNLFNNIVTIKNMFDRLDDVAELTNYIKSNENLIYDKIRENCDKIIKGISDTINLEYAEEVNTFNFEKLEKSFFKRGLNEDFDKLEENLYNEYDKLIAYKNYFNKLFDNPTPEFVKIENKKENKKDDIQLTITDVRSKKLKTILSSDKINAIVDFNYKSTYNNSDKVLKISTTNIEFGASTSNNKFIKMIDIKNTVTTYLSLRQDLNVRMQCYYDVFIKKLQNYNNEFNNIIEYIGLLDVLVNKVKIATKFNYCKPIIRKKNNAYINATKIRHCLIEHLQTSELYVANDINLDETKSGILLYGTNAVGKTSFIRSIGICIIMAQAGLYVPCETFTFSPYNKIFSRILGNDNLFKGLSTFAVEMYELKSILENSDNNSLILGDELCSGTEIESAISIFVTGLQYLHDKNSSFIFATHLHEITKYSEITSLEKLDMKHLTVEYNEATGKLIFDRIIKDGPGRSSYGLEFCKSINLPDNFLNDAFSLRNKYNNNLSSLDLKTSHFNSNKIIGICEICKQQQAVDCHHLQYQCDSNENGYINNDNSLFNKNHKANLCAVCKSCHDKIHIENKRYKRIKTSEGYEIIEI